MEIIVSRLVQDHDYSDNGDKYSWYEDDFEFGEIVFHSMLDAEKHINFIEQRNGMKFRDYYFHYTDASQTAFDATTIYTFNFREEQS